MLERFTCKLLEGARRITSWLCHRLEKQQQGVATSLAILDNLGLLRTCYKTLWKDSYANNFAWRVSVEDSADKHTVSRSLLAI